MLDLSHFRDDDDLQEVVVVDVDEDDDELLNLSGCFNLSRDAGYSPSPVAPTTSVSSRSAPASVVAEPPPKKSKPSEKKKVRRTEDERLADLEVRCHEDVIARVDFVGGLQASNMTRIVCCRDQHAFSCLGFVFKSTGASSPHVLRLMSGLELVRMLRERAGQTVVETLENMDALVETLKDAHPGKQLTFVLYELDKALKDGVRQGLFADVASAREVVDKATARLQARFCCNISRHKTLREAGIGVGKIGRAIAAHLDDAERLNDNLHGHTFTVDANGVKGLHIGLASCVEIRLFDFFFSKQKSLRIAGNCGQPC